MKANELRIGNYVTLNNDVKIVNGNLIKEQQQSEMIIGEIYLEPIPLTEEWLLKFGFIRHHNDYLNDVIYIKNVPDNTEFEWGVYPNELGSGIQIKNRILLHSVHQLQNIYFALVGEELILKSE